MMKTVVKYIVFSFFAFTCVNNYSQSKLSYEVKRCKRPDGKSFSQTWKAFQDSLGIIWFLAPDKLEWYDGLRFHEFSTGDEELDLEFIDSNSFMSMDQDRHQNYWIGTGNGLIKYNWKENDISIYKADSGKPGKLMNRSIFSMEIGEDDIIWLGHWYGITRFDPVNETFTNYVIPLYDNNNFSQCATAMLLDDETGILWVGTWNGGVYLFDTKEKKFVKTLRTNKYGVKDLGKDFIKSIFEDLKGDFWIPTWNGGVYVFNSQGELLHIINSEHETYNLLSDRVHGVICDPASGDYWIAGENGVNIINLENKINIALQADPFNESTIPDNTTTCLFLDKQGGIWMGAKLGISYYHPDRIKFNTFNSKDTEFEKTFRLGILDFVEYPKGNIWVSSISGTRIWDQKQNKMYRPIEKGFTLPDDFMVEEAIEHPNGKVYFFSQNTIFEFDPATKIVEKIEMPEYLRLPFSEIYKAIKLESGEIIFGKQKMSLVGFSPEKREFRQIIGDGQLAITYESVLNVKGDTLFIMSAFDIFAINLQTEDVEVLSSTEYRSRYKQGTLVNDKYFTFVSDYKKQIFRYFDLNKMQWFNSLDIKEFEDNMIQRLFIDTLNGFWFFSEKGLLYHSKNDSLTILYDDREGLRIADLTNSAIFQAQNGEIFISYGNGFNYFQPTGIIRNTEKPKVFLTTMDINNQRLFAGKDSIITKHISLLDEIKLNHKQNSLSFSFVINNYLLAEKNQYRYILEGYEDDWKYDYYNNNEIRYDNLPPGKYKLLLNGSNNDAVWNDKYVELSIIIKPPFWKTWLFRICVVVIIGLSIYFFVQFRLTRVKKQNLRLANLVRERTTEIRYKNTLLEKQAANLKEINTLLNDRTLELEEMTRKLSGQSDELLEKNKVLDRLNATKDKFFSIIARDLINPFQAITRISSILKNNYAGIEEDKKLEMITMVESSSKGAENLLENLLVWARSQTNRIKYQPRPIIIQELVDETLSLLRLNAERKNLLLESKIDISLIAFADPNMINMVVRNLLNNAIKYTPENGKVEFDAYKDDKGIVLTIKDSGVGMDDETIQKLFRIDEQVSKDGTDGEKGTGLGLLICKEFIDKNKGRIWVQSKPGKGTVFLIRLPESSEKAEMASRPIKIQTEAENDDPQMEVHAKETEGNKKVKKIALLVEDDMNIQKMVSDCLEDRYEIREAANGTLGYKLAIDVVPDIIILDVNIPEMGGFELWEKVKMDSRTSHIPIILLTENPDDKDRVRGIETGADDYIIKPFDEKMLVARVANLIQSHERLKARFSKSIILEPKDIAITSSDERFLHKTMAIIEKHLDDEKLTVEFLTSKLNMSRSQLFRKMKALVDQSPNEFIRSFRLKRAAHLLLNSDLKVNEISIKIGYKETTYFSKVFKKQFGVNPSEYRNE